MTRLLFSVSVLLLIPCISGPARAGSRDSRNAADNAYNQYYDALKNTSGSADDVKRLKSQIIAPAERQYINDERREYNQAVPKPADYGQKLGSKDGAADEQGREEVRKLRDQTRKAYDKQFPDKKGKKRPKDVGDDFYECAKKNGLDQECVKRVKAKYAKLLQGKGDMGGDGKAKSGGNAGNGSGRPDLVLDGKNIPKELEFSGKKKKKPGDK